MSAATSRGTATNETPTQSRLLRPHQKFIPVPVIELEFGDDGVHTANFIEKVQELSQRESVKKCGGFMVLRPKNGASVFTNGSVADARNPPRHVYDAIPSLQRFKDKSVLYDIQKASNFKVPKFAWNAQHKQSVLETQHQRGRQGNAPRNLNTSRNAKSNDNSNATVQINKNRWQPLVLDGNGAEHDHGDEKQETLPSRPHSNTTTTTSNMCDDGNVSYTADDLQFYRGFCCMTHRHDDHLQKPLASFIDEMEHKMQSTQYVSPYADTPAIEDKYLVFLRHLYECNVAHYGHIEAGDGLSCYASQSPFDAESLAKYGPFSCLEPEELTHGVQKPYIYIGESHTFFPWHVEDLCFHAMNHLLYGARKIWYCISPDDYAKVMRFFRAQFKHYYPDCLTPLQHKNTIMDPYLFRSLDIDVFCIEQQAGDIVIAPPGGLHCGFNEAFNVAESVNFMSFDDSQWRVSLHAMLLRSLNYHDCCATEHDLGSHTDTLCLCCSKDCTNPERRFACKCTFCDSLKCPCDYTIFLDMNALAQRVRDKFSLPIASVPEFDVASWWREHAYAYKYEIYNPRRMGFAEIDARCHARPQCQLEHVYPTQDRKDLKFYPAICAENRIVARGRLFLSYRYKMDFIAFGEYFQICDDSQIITVGGIEAQTWNNPPIERQHGFYDKRGDQKHNTPRRRSRTQLKGTPSFDFLDIALNAQSPLVGTAWQSRAILFKYPPGARKFNVAIRAKRCENRRGKEKEAKIAVLANLQRNALASAKHKTIHHDGINTLRRKCVDIAQCSDAQVAAQQSTHFSNEEYKTTPSPPTSESDGEAEVLVKSRERDDDAWTPETNQWQTTLPEHEYKNLRNRKSCKNSKKKTENPKMSVRNRKRKRSDDDEEEDEDDDYSESELNDDDDEDEDFDPDEEYGWKSKRKSRKPKMSASRSPKKQKQKNIKRNVKIKTEKSVESDGESGSKTRKRKKHKTNSAPKISNSKKKHSHAESKNKTATDASRHQHGHSHSHNTVVDTGDHGVAHLANMSPSVQTMASILSLPISTNSNSHQSHVQHFPPQHAQLRLRDSPPQQTLRFGNYNLEQVKRFMAMNQWNQTLQQQPQQQPNASMSMPSFSNVLIPAQPSLMMMSMRSPNTQMTLSSDTVNNSSPPQAQRNQLTDIATFNAQLHQQFHSWHAPPPPK